jgi:DNA-binding CsgD family transcriptional regulator
VWHRDRVLPLIGRDAERDALVAAFGRCRTQASQVVVVDGVPGSGSRGLVDALRRELTSRRLAHTWCATRAGPVGHLPYAALVPLLQPTDVTLDDLLRDLSHVPAPARAAVAGERLARAWAASATRQPLVLVAHDVHLLDPSTRGALVAALAALPRTHVLAVVTTEPDGQADALAALGVRLTLGPLAPSDARALAEQTLAGRPPGGWDPATVVQVARGLPGVIVGLARADDPGHPLGEWLDEQPGTAALLQALAWADGWLPGDEVAALAGTPAQALVRLDDAGALAWPPDRRGPVPAHAVWLVPVRVPPAPARAMARALAVALSQAGAPPAVLAGVREQAGERTAASAAWLLAADEAAAAMAPELEAEHLVAASACADGPTRARLLPRTAERLVSTGAAARAEALLDEGLAQLPRGAHASRARLLVLRYRARYHQGDLTGADADLDEALRLANGADDPAVAGEAAVLEALRVATRDAVRARRYADQAVALTTVATGRPSAAALGALAIAAGTQGDLAAALPTFDEALAEAERSHDPAAAGRIAANRIFVLWRAGEVPALARAVDDELDRLQRLGLVRSAGGHLLVARGVALQTLGEWDELVRHLDAQLAQAHLLSDDVACLLMLLQVELAAARGDRDAARAALGALEGRPALASPEVAYEHVAVRLGLVEVDPTAATARAAMTDARRLLPSLDGDAFAQARVRLALLRAAGALASSGRPEPALDAAAALPPASAVGHEMQALLAEQRAWAQGGADAWAQAAHAWEKLPNPYRAAWCRLHAAEHLPDAQADPLLDLAAAVAARLGARPLLEQVGRAQRARGRRSPRSEGPLTARETDVLRQVALGRTNREVARALGMSDRTVAVHLTRIFAKLQAGTRGEVVHVARQTGLLDD